MKLSELWENKKKIKDYKLIVPQGFESVSDSDLLKKVNGIGPEYFPDSIRELFDDLFQIFSPAALLHDIAYASQEKSIDAFDRANADFYSNCKTIINCQNYWIFKRWYREHQAYLLFSAVQEWGFEAFLRGK
jgi:hypothetical protein